jgi:nucleoside-diphosphate-sugar epimerase
MKFIVTGAGGFIGHNVVRQLTRLGHDCFNLDNFTNYGFIPDDELAYLKQGRVNRMRHGVHHIDLLDSETLEDFMRSFSWNCDAVIHLASFPRQKVVLDNPILGSQVMSTGLVNLLELTRRYQVPKFVYVSSSMVYGDFNNDVAEDAVCNPIGQYAIMKYMGEQLVKDYTRRGHFEHVIVRPSAVYGEWDVDDRVVSKFMTRAIQNKKLKICGAQEVLDFTHVDDTALGIALASSKQKAVNNTYNITRSDTSLHTLLDAANLIIKIAGSGQIKIEDRDLNFPSRGRLSIDKARTDLGFDPQINIEEGFTRYHNWFKESKFWQGKL